LCFFFFRFFFLQCFFLCFFFALAVDPAADFVAAALGRFFLWRLHLFFAVAWQLGDTAGGFELTILSTTSEPIT
jgi:hypothetical protein